MLETESLAKAKGGSMDCFVYDPANPPPKKPAPPVPVESASPPSASLGVEVFGGKLFSGTSLEDAKGVEKLLSEPSAPPPPATTATTTHSTRVASPIEYLVKLKKEIQQLKEDASRTVPEDPLVKTRQLEQTLEPVLADVRVSPYLPHISPSFCDVDPVDALIIRVRATEGAVFQASGKQPHVQPVLLEQQVTALERVVGQPAAKGGVSLRKKVTSLQHDMNILDPTFLVSSSRRIKSLLTELVLLDQQKRAVDVALPAEVQTRIDALSALNAKHAATIQEVVKPNSPLTTPNPQHEQAARVLQRLNALAHQQKLASELLNADGASLKTASENLINNMKLMKANIANLEQRLKALPR